MSDDFETLTLIFNNVPANPSIDVQTTVKRCFIDDLRAYVGVPVVPTGIEEVKSEKQKVKSDAIYTLTGQRILTPQRGGIYIVGGRKVRF